MCVAELLREEQRAATQATMGADLSLFDVAPVAYAAQGRGKGKLQCFYCKGYGHIARACLRKVCNHHNQGISSRSVLHDLRTGKLGLSYGC